LHPRGDSPSPLETKPAASEKLDLDSVAAIIYLPGRRYLLQHREDRGDISYPNCWGLFGGAREAGEEAETALRREMMEELEFSVGAFSLFVGCTFDLRFEVRRTRKIFFSVEMTEAEACGLVLREGQGMAWLGFHEILARAEDVVPYDLGMIALHHQRLGE
jgi:8-oxo-dGTP pyrophosphatase MutT (NUDIX family)